jgi:carboxyl-terminal processing protease
MKDIFKSINGTVVLIGLIAFLAGWQLGHRDVSLQWNQYHPSIKVENKQPPKNVNIDFKLFWDTWDLVSKDYLDKKAIDPQKMFYGAIQGMVAAVGDPYTMFLPPEQQKATSEDLGGSFSGVGLELGFNKDRRLVVMAPLDDTPAAKANIRANDIIVKINDEDTTGMSITDAVKLIRGQKGTEVILTIFREGEDQTRDITLIRDTIVVKSVKLSFLDTKTNKKIAWVKLTRFGERTSSEWNDAVGQILASNTQGLILDVRNNPGGLLDDAVYVGSEFLEGGDVVIVENAKGEKNYQKVNRAGKLLKLPMYVLVNKGSASASEIVAGALQDRKRAKLIGEQTFGKGTVQEALELPGGTGIHITTAKWLTPNLRWANDTEGFKPDIEVTQPLATASASVSPQPSANPSQSDLQLQKALELLQ